MKIGQRIFRVPSPDTVDLSLIFRVALIAVLLAIYAITFMFLFEGAMGPANMGPAKWISGGLLGAALIALSGFDIAEWRLPDVLTLPLAVVGVVLAWPLSAEALLAATGSAALGFLVLYAVARAFERSRGYPGLGLGDAKLFAAAGAWVGAAALPMVLLVASVLALAVAGIAYLMGLQVDRRTRLPFGPFLAYGIWVVWLTGLQ